MSKNLNKPGYKHTKLGLIPEDWEFVELDNFLERRKTKYNPKTDEVNHKCIELEHINQDSASINGYCDSINQKSIKSVFDKGEVLFGKLRPYLRKYWLSTFDGVCSSEIWVLRGINRKANNNYIGFLVQTHRFIESSNKTSGSKMPRADWDLMSKIPFPLPPLLEQQKIAAILSTWDTAIGQQQALITAKQHYKKGLMQNLLTGKKRFPGFKEKWKEVKLGEVFALSSGKTKPKNSIDSFNEGFKIPVYGGNGITAYTDKIFDSGMRLLIGRVGEYCGCVHLVDGDYWITDNCLYSYNHKEDCSLEFLFFLLTYIQLDRLKNVGGQPLVSQKPILKLRIKLPPIPEQQKIAAVISAADAEIEKLKTQLTALQAQKKGLMQKLLSGEVRVKVN